MPINLYTSSTENVFFNSKCLFVEYSDIIKMPMFMVLLAIHENEMINTIFDLSDIWEYPPEALFEWYINRKERNIFMNFPIKVESNEGKSRDQICHEILNDLLAMSESLYCEEAELSFSRVIKSIMTQKILVQKIVVYNEYDNQFIRNDIKKLYEDNVVFMNGKFETVIENIPEDSTFVFSDINKVNRLVEMKRINMSSIVIPSNFRYNRDLSDIRKWKVDFETLGKSFVFKYNFFDNMQ